MSAPRQSLAARYPAHAVGLAALALLLFSFRAVIADPAGGFLGTSTDAVHHAWGLWWFAQPGREGALTTLVSFPNGEVGALLSPITAALTWPLQRIGGPAFAYNGALFGSVALLALGVGLLTGRLTRSAPAGATAAALIVMARPVQAHVGLGLLEGVALGWGALALWQAVGWLRGARAAEASAPTDAEGEAPRSSAPEADPAPEAVPEPAPEVDTLPERAADAETSTWPAEPPEAVESPVEPAIADVPAEAAVAEPVAEPSRAARLRAALAPWAPWRHRPALWTGLLFAVAVLENPYSLALMAPAALIVAVLRARPWSVLAARELATAALGGLLPVVARLIWLGGDLGGNPTPAATFSWLGQTWSAYDTYRLFDPMALLQPFPVMTFSGTMSEVLSRGGDRFLGFSALLAAVLGALWGGRAARVAVAVAAIAVALSAGSLPWGEALFPGPFWALNAALGAVLPPLTQPDRFLVVASAALAVAGGAGVAALAARQDQGEGWTGWRTVAVVIALEGVLLGGPALAVPVTGLRDYSCFAMLTDAQPSGAVHMLPTGDQAAEQANSAALTLQLLHRRPGTHHGVGGWRVIPRPQRLGHALASLDGSARTAMPDPSLTGAMSDLLKAEIAWIVADEGDAPAWLGAPRLACGGWAAWALESVRLSRGGPRAPMQGGPR